MPIPPGTVLPPGMPTYDEYGNMILPYDPNVNGGMIMPPPMLDMNGQPIVMQPPPQP